MFVHVLLVATIHLQVCQMPPPQALAKDRCTLIASTSGLEMLVRAELVC